MIFVSEYVRVRDLVTYRKYESGEIAGHTMVTCACCGVRLPVGCSVNTELWDLDEFKEVVCCDKCGLPLRSLQQLRFSPSTDAAHPPIPDEIEGLQD